MYIVCSFLFYFFLLVRVGVFVCAGGCDERESPEDEEKMRWRFLLFAPFKALPFECALFNPGRACRGVRILILSFSSYRCTYLSRAHS